MIISVLVVIILLSPGLQPRQAVVEAAAAPGFTVASAVWGSAANPVEAAPGILNVPLTVTLQYNYFNTAQGISVLLDLPVGFTDTNGDTSTTAYYANAVASGTVLSFTFNLDIASSVSVGTYIFPMVISWGAVVNNNPVQSVSETQDASAVVALKGKVQLQFSAGQTTLTPGQVNQIPLIVSNTGSGNATDVLLGISATSTLLSSATVSVLNTPPEILFIRPGGSSNATLSIYAPQSLAASSISLSIAGTYSDAYGNTHSIAATIGAYVQSTASATITVTARSLQLTPGSVNNVTLVISNGGSLSFDQLEVNVVVPPSVSLLRQFPVTLAGLAAGASTVVSMPIFVSDALSGTPITIPATVTYTDVAGGTGSTIQNVGFYVPIAQSPNIGLSGFAYNPALIFPGTVVASLQVAIFNSGTSPGSNVNATLVPSSPVYSLGKGSLSQTAGLLPVGQSVPFTFTIGILNSTEPLNSTLKLILSASGVEPTQFGIPFVEQPKADFKIVSVNSPVLASGDGADQIIVTIRNTGMASAQLATFTMQPSYVFEPSTQGSFTTTPNVGAGTLSPGRSANVTVVIQVNSNLQAGSYPLVFHATWSQLGSSQPFGQDLVLMLPVKASVFQMADNILFSVPFLAVLVIVVVLLLAVRTARRARGKPKPKEAPA